MEITEMSRSLLKDFVHPDLCVKLQQIGLKVKTNYIWYVCNNLASLHTFEFDFDNYYKSSTAFLKSINQSYEVPAFTMANLEAILPGYTLQKNCQNMYSLQLNEDYRINKITGLYLPNVIATALIELLENKRIDLRLLNKIIYKH